MRPAFVIGLALHMSSLAVNQNAVAKVSELSRHAHVLTVVASVKLGPLVEFELGFHDIAMELENVTSKLRNFLVGGGSPLSSSSFHPSGTFNGSSRALSAADSSDYLADGILKGSFFFGCFVQSCLTWPVSRQFLQVRLSVFVQKSRR